MMGKDAHRVRKPHAKLVESEQTYLLSRDADPRRRIRLRQRLIRSTDTAVRRSAEFLEFAQAAGGFGVFELNLVTGNIKGTSLFFELIGLECRDMSLTREEWLASIHPEDLEGVVCTPSAMPSPPAAATRPNTAH